VRVERAEDFLPALETALKSDRTTLIDVITDQRAYPPVTSFEDNDRLAY
jgi:acetolactate synthase-1/2/3 large subunit